MANVQIGMSKDQVIQALKRKPEKMIAAKEYDDGIVEVIEYSGLVGGLKGEGGIAGEMETYWLYFFNDRLVEWMTPPPDREVFIERIYRKEVRDL